MGIMSKLKGGIVSAIGGSIKSVAEVFTTNKEAKSQREHEKDMSGLNKKEAKSQRGHDRDMSGLKQYAAEFRQIDGRTWFDSLVDGMNRMIRPCIVVGLGYYMYLSVKDPIEFAKTNVGLDTIPDDMWSIIISVIGFYFVIREVHHHRKGKDKKEMVQAIKTMKELDSMKEPEPVPVEETTGNVVVDEYLAADQLKTPKSTS